MLMFLRTAETAPKPLTVRRAIRFLCRWTNKDVRRAASALDIEAPQWESRVDVTHLDICDWQSCICYYAFGRNGWLTHARSLAVRYRFSLFVFSSPSYEGAWKNEIALRIE